MDQSGSTGGAIDLDALAQHVRQQRDRQQRKGPTETRNDDYDLRRTQKRQQPATDFLAKHIV